MRISRLAVSALLAAVAAAGAALAQAPPPPAPQQTPQERSEQMLQQIQKDNEAVLAGRHFTYDPAGRRDPFEPLVKLQKERDAKRPKGIAGMGVGEIDLRGVATDVRGAPVAMFRGTDNRGYSLHVGDVVYDGRVMSIDVKRGIVVFRQQVDDPRRIKPYRDVIKRLQVKGGEEEAAEEEGA